MAIKEPKRDVAGKTLLDGYAFEVVELLQNLGVVTGYEGVLREVSSWLTYVNGATRAYTMLMRNTFI